MNELPRPSRLRLGVLGVVAVSLFAALFARLGHLQVVASPAFREVAERHSIRSVVEPAPRGRILDRDGVVLVDNRPANVVAVDRHDLPAGRRAPVLRRLAAALGRPVAELEARLDDEGASPYVPVTVAEDVPEAVMVALQERRAALPGVVAQRVARRSYPYASLAAHVLGYVGEVTPEDVARAPGSFRPGQGVGKAGIERMYDADLRGVDGEVRIEVDAEGVPVRVLDRRRPVPGDDVVLSLDVGLQQAAEASLVAGLEGARARSFRDDGSALAADAGAAVVLDAAEGTVAAMASWPSFDLPALADGVSTAEAAALFDASAGAPFTNRAVQGEYAPGSTWKPVTALAALGEGLVSPTTTVLDEGVFRLPDCTSGCEFTNAGGTRHGTVDLRQALTVSSDVYFYQQGYELWERRGQLGEAAIQDAAAALGFGAETGVELPAEAEGRLASPALRSVLHADDPAAYPEGSWYPGDNVNLAIGQGELSVTPVQLAAAYASLGRAGARFAPNLVLRVQDREGNELRAVAPRPLPPAPMAPAETAPILEGLLGVTQAPGGTATPAFAGWPHATVPVAGKTGTAQVPGRQDTALFAAVAPAGDPRYALSVVMEQGGFGADAAAPVARSILAEALLP